MYWPRVSSNRMDSGCRVASGKSFAGMPETVEFYCFLDGFYSASRREGFVLIQLHTLFSEPQNDESVCTIDAMYALEHRGESV